MSPYRGESRFHPTRAMATSVQRSASEQLQRFLSGCCPAQSCLALWLAECNGTGCAYLGDRSLDPLAGESVSDSSAWESVGGCLASATFLHSGTSIRNFNLKDIACPSEGSMAPQVYALAAQDVSGMRG